MSSRKRLLSFGLKDLREAYLVSYLSDGKQHCRVRVVWDARLETRAEGRSNSLDFDASSLPCDSPIQFSKHNPSFKLRYTHLVIITERGIYRTMDKINMFEKNKNFG